MHSNKKGMETNKRHKVKEECDVALKKISPGEPAAQKNKTVSPGKRNQTEMGLATVAEQWTARYGLIVPPKLKLTLLSNAIVLNGGVFRARLRAANRTSTCRGQYGGSTVTPTLMADHKGSLRGEFPASTESKVCLTGRKNSTLFAPPPPLLLRERTA